MKQSDSIDIRLQDAARLFNSLDPSPFHERELGREVEAFIVDAARELPSPEGARLRVFVSQAGAQAHQQMVSEAVRHHFERRAGQTGKELSDLLGRGRRSTLVGLVFLGMMMGVARLMDELGGEGLLAIIREGVGIAGWVAMWRPMEIFLYDWWHVNESKKLYLALSRMEVRVEPCAPEP